MEILHKFDVGQEVYLIRNNKLDKGVVTSITINITKNKIGIKNINTCYYVKFKGYGNVYMQEKQMSDTPENLLKNLKKTLKK